MSKKNDKKKEKSSFLTKPLTKKRFRKELKAQIRSEFKPLSRELQKQDRLSKLRSQQTSRYFQQYQQAIGRVRASSDARYAQAGQAMNDYASAAGSQNAALQGQLAAQSQQNATLYGQTPNSDSVNLAVQGEANRTRNGADMAGMIQAQGANTHAYLSGQQANSKLARIEALQAEARTRRQISSDKQDLIRERADFRQQYMADAREGDRRYELALKELRNSKTQAHKDRTQARKEARKDREQGRRDNRHANESGNGEKGKGGDNVKKNAASLMNRYYDPKKDTWRSLAAMLNGELDIPASRANQLAKAWLKRHGKGGGKKKGGGISKDPNGPSLGR